MRKHTRTRTLGRLVTLGLLAGLLAPTARAGALEGTPETPDGDIRARVEAVPGMRLTGEKPAAPGYRYFELSYRQPVDHRHPERGTFEQRLTLLHKSVRQPMVLYTTGYALGADPAFRSEPTKLVDGNQISTEQRYFGTSRPQSQAVDYTTLDIWQAASDHHRLIRALKALYGGPWISTGGSKGGMTAVYHRRFYPRDVNGTVAYSAPNNTDDRDDTAYDALVERLGTESCRAALKAAQREALVRRTELAGRYTEWAAKEQRTFTTVGSADRALELAVLRAVPMFWQYGDAAKCADVPAPTASTDELYTWLDATTGLKNYTDQVLGTLTPYFHQLGTQLGYPQYRAPHLDGLLRHPGVQDVRTYVPRDIPLRFQPHAMADIDRWVRHHGSELLFVYGDNDPATAERFRLGRGSRDAYVEVASANHRARLTDLAPDARARAEAALGRWAGR
ncbi:S28 family serine protease [Streptomyces sp. QH1-20]|uniref:S28 family serine protease n=1 Tax=Streptomyces sp. QH1-20 TaxID=3240934 RepID=UPI003517DFB7